MLGLLSDITYMVPGSCLPCAKTELKPFGAAFRVWSSCRIILGAPSATSFKNIIPVPSFAVPTKTVIITLKCGD